MMRAASLPTCLAVLLATCACSDVTTNLVDEHKAAIAAPAPAQGKDASTAPVADAAAPHAPALCGDHVCACDDGKDNDGDALIDGLDPECTGPLDDDERTFATGQPNRGGGKCRDCFWDSNAGVGKGGCDYANACLQGLAPARGEKCTCEVSDTCKQSCQVLTPNGCDCFGCCDVTRADGSVISILLDDSCALAKIDDETACPRCQQSSACRNPCGECELCPGRTSDDLPASCTTHATAEKPVYACDEGQQVCGADAPCPLDYYCQLGCCRYVVP